MRETRGLENPQDHPDPTQPFMYKMGPYCLTASPGGMLTQCYTGECSPPLPSPITASHHVVTCTTAVVMQVPAPSANPYKLYPLFQAVCTAPLGAHPAVLTRRFGMQAASFGDLTTSRFVNLRLVSISHLCLGRALSFEP